MNDINEKEELKAIYVTRTNDGVLICSDDKMLLSEIEVVMNLLKKIKSMGSSINLKPTN